MDSVHTPVAHVIPPVPVRQWVISAPKRLRGFLADRPDGRTPGGLADGKHARQPEE